MTHAEYMVDYQLMTSAAVKVEGSLLERLVQVCQHNDRLRVGGIDFEPEGFCPESDYAYCLERYDAVEMLERFFARGHWANGAAVQHHDLAFVIQVNGGDELWTLKFDGDRLVPFESITFRRIIADGAFPAYIQRLRSRVVEQCRRYEF